MRSMTGFGAGRRRSERFEVTVELRSVNHRFLQLKQKLPPELSDLEPKLEGHVKGALERGAVNLYLKLEAAPGHSLTRVDVDAARGYRSALQALASEVGRAGELTLGDWLRLPGILASGRDESEIAELAELAEGATQDAVAALVEMRTKEGAELAADLGGYSGELRELRAKIDERMPVVVKSHAETLAERVSKLLENERQLEPSDLAREVALLADKLDVSEELSRLTMHFDHLEQLLGSDGAVGKKLDFLVQELLREFNTIGSKCSDAPVAHLVIDAKAILERLREQVQNVE